MINFKPKHDNIIKKMSWAFERPEDFTIEAHVLIK